MIFFLKKKKEEVRYDINDYIFNFGKIYIMSEIDVFDMNKACTIVISFKN